MKLIHTLLASIVATSAGFSATSPCLAVVANAPLKVMAVAAADKPSASRQDRRAGERSAFLSPFIASATPDMSSPNATPKGAIVVDFLPELLDMIPKASTFDLVQFPLPDGSIRDLWLTEFNPIADDATTVVVERGPNGEDVLNYGYAPKIRAFRGHVVGADRSLVYLAFSESAISGFIEINDSVLTISNGPRGERPVTISDLQNLPAGAINWRDFTCHTKSQPTDDNSGGSGGDGGIAALPSCKVLRLGFETDNEFRALFNSNQAAIDYVAQISAAMNVIYYEEENLYPTLAYVNVYSVGTNDPWTVNNDVGNLLIQFKDRWQNTPAVPGGGVPAGAVTCGLKQLLSGKPLGGGIADAIGGTCIDQPNNGLEFRPDTRTDEYAVSADLSGFFPFPLQDNSFQNWDIIVASHEAGHVLGCLHTHDLTPPYDNCVSGGCLSTGTIMSYCHLCPGGLSNIVFRFAPPNKAQMDVWLAGPGGACSGFAQPCPIYVPSNFRASDGTFADGVSVTWRLPAVAAERFELERRESGTVDWFLVDDQISPTVSSYLDVSADVGVLYEFRIRAILVSDGTPSDWVGPDNGYRAELGPTNLVATDGVFSTKIALTFDAPVGYSPTCYRIYRATAGSEMQWIDQTSTASYDDRGVYADPDPGIDPPQAPTAGTLYFYEVRALVDAGSCALADGDSIVSAPVKDTGFQSQPGATNLLASGAVDGSPLPLTNRVKVTWNLPAYSVSRVYVMRAVGSNEFQEMAVLVGNQREWSDLFALSNVAYTYKVRCFSSLVGISAPSNTDLGFRLEPPSIVSASDGTGSNVNLVWTRPTSWAPSSYAVWRKPAGRAEWPAAPLVENLASTQLTYTDTSAVPGTVYIYSITGKSSLFNSWSDRGRTDNGYPVVLPPTGLSASDGEFPGYVQVLWTPAGATTGVSWEVYRRRANTNDAYVRIKLVTQPFHLDSTAAIGTTYQYYIKTRASNGVLSAPSTTDTGFRTP